MEKPRVEWFADGYRYVASWEHNMLRVRGHQYYGEVDGRQRWSVPAVVLDVPAEALERLTTLRAETERLQQLAQEMTQDPDKPTTYPSTEF